MLSDNSNATDIFPNQDRTSLHSLVYREVFLAHHELKVIYDDMVDVIHVDGVLHGVQNCPVNRSKCKGFLV